jgi:hypothetical protein
VNIICEHFLLEKYMSTYRSVSGGKIFTRSKAIFTVTSLRWLYLQHMYYLLEYLFLRITISSVLETIIPMYHEQLLVNVPDRRRRIIHEVFLVGRGQLGSWEFGGGRVWVKGWNRGSQFTSNLRLRWTDPVTARRVPSK